MIPSSHFKDRAKKRIGLSKNASSKFLNKAEANGFRLEDTKKCKILHKYLSGLIIDENVYNVILYNRYVILYRKATEVSITVLHLPVEYHKYEDRLKEKGKCQNEQNED